MNLFKIWTRVANFISFDEKKKKKLRVIVSRSRVLQENISAKQNWIRQITKYSFTFNFYFPHIYFSSVSLPRSQS